MQFFFSLHYFFSPHFFRTFGPKNCLSTIVAFRMFEKIEDCLQSCVAGSAVPEKNSKKWRPETFLDLSRLPIQPRGPHCQETKVSVVLRQQIDGISLCSRCFLASFFSGRSFPHKAPPPPVSLAKSTFFPPGSLYFPFSRPSGFPTPSPYCPPFL